MFMCTVVNNTTLYELTNVGDEILSSYRRERESPNEIIDQRRQLMPVYAGADADELLSSIKAEVRRAGPSFVTINLE